MNTLELTKLELCIEEAPLCATCAASAASGVLAIVGGSASIISTPHITLPAAVAPFFHSISLII